MQVSQNSQAFTVDIATRILEPSEDIFILQPGQGYWLYDVFKRSNHIFLDFPGMPLEFSTPAPDDRTLRQMAVRSIALRDWYDENMVGKRPSDNLADYVGKDTRKRLGRYVGAIKRLYWDLEPGAIIVVPGPHFSDDVLIGQITGKPTVYSSKQIYEGSALPARRVKWLRSKPRASFSKEVREKFGKPNPITQLDRSLRAEIMRAGFDQFVIDDEISVRLNTTADDFNTLDDFNIQTFVNYVAGVLVAVDLGIQHEVSFDEAIKLLRAHPDMVPDLKQNINSIGFQRIVSETVKPLVIATMLSLATAPVAPGMAADSVPVAAQVVNSAAPAGDSCTIKVSARVEAAMKLMKLDEWKRVCESARDANASTGLSTTMKVGHSRKANP
ncbi:hypothetical protein [Sphingobium sp. YBL2]|uniref:hypothetical protein n=1 Tax=Sphingobium sp. (strain YBL2) TaxID=484429 RepID=UPI0005CC54E5|nr:hypothetical protein [Sphingobium sp. YBL2]AJR24578.1 hypothetical protein TZ53_13450 [Sphingobium sp. YBL2]